MATFARPKFAATAQAYEAEKEISSIKKEWRRITEANKAAGVKLAEERAAATALNAEARDNIRLGEELVEHAQQKLAVIASRACIICNKGREETGINFAICDACVTWKGESDDEEQGA